jgi:hypothetical protein
MQRTLLTLVALFVGLLPLTALAQESPFTKEAPAGVQNMRPDSQLGLNVFETPKTESAPFTGIDVDWGAAFTQQFQGLDHSNTAAEIRDDNGVNQNQLYGLGNGFNLATANLRLDAQLAQGVRVNLVTYLSSRHHTEAWVKGGYLQVDDASWLGVPAIDKVFDYVTVKAGHYEINYGDAHFRRTDNGNAIFNPFVGNYLLDAFTTEIGGEITAQYKGGLAVLGVTGGEIKGDISENANPERSRAPSIYGKLGVDRQVNDDLRVRLTGSMYTTSSSASNTLFAGDRAGSRYYLVLENTAASAGSNFRSGMVNPGFNDKVTTFMVNPFVKFHGLEVFGLYETADGRSFNETETRNWSQYAVDGVFRFAPREQLFVGARYNSATGQFAGFENDVTINRYEIGAGWFVTPNVLAKVEYVSQQYEDFPHENINCGGEFNGFMVEGVVAF